MQFAKRAAEIISNCTSSIIYTADIGPIVNRCRSRGSGIPWGDGCTFKKEILHEVKVIVATKAFGMGIDKPDIRHVIRNGVPESMLC